MFGISFIKLKTKFSYHYYHTGDGKTFFIYFIFGVFFWLTFAHLWFGYNFFCTRITYTDEFTYVTCESFIQSTRYTHTFSYPSTYNFLQFDHIDIVNVSHIRFSHLSIFIDLVSFSQTLTTTKFLSKNWHFFTNQQLLFFLSRILFLFNDFDWEFSSFWN